MSSTYEGAWREGEDVHCPQCKTFLINTEGMEPRPPDFKGPWNVNFCPSCDSEVNIEITAFKPVPKDLCAICLREAMSLPTHSKLTRSKMLEMLNDR